MKKLRQQSLERKQAKEQEREKERLVMREQQKKYAVREQMRVGVLRVSWSLLIGGGSKNVFLHFVRFNTPF